MAGKYVNLQISFNLNNKSHRQLIKWIDEQTTNRSGFIRETLVMRMMGFQNVNLGNQPSNNVQVQSFDEDEVFRLIQV